MSIKPTGYGLADMSYDERQREAYKELIKRYPPNEKGEFPKLPEGYVISLHERYGIGGPTESELVVNKAFHLELEAERLMAQAKKKKWLRK